MKKLLFISLIISFHNVFSQNIINAELNFNKIEPISPYIYGYNQDHEVLNSADKWTIRRLGGNRLTAFNWENGASNAGHDLGNSSDNRIPNLVGVPLSNKDLPGEAYRVFHQNNLNAGVTSIITFPILGWVAADKAGTVTTAAPSNRWNQLIYQKRSAFSLKPNLTDGKVYLDEGYNFLLHHFGNATTANGIKYISLDNEPAYWDNLHSLIQPAPPTILEYVAKVIAAAKMVKTMDPNVKVILGEFGGINIYDFSGATDWSELKNGFDWFPSFLLDTLKKESIKFGQPLVDYFSFHFYPQQKIDVNGNYSSSGTIVRNSNSTADYIREGRMDLPRSLYDTTYIEPSWLTPYLTPKPNKILHRLQKSIDTYFPEVEIMIGEYDFGFDTDISHAIAMVDFYGMSGQYKVGIATRWDLNPYNGSTYTNTALKFFRNYDRANGSFGTKAVKSSFNNPGDGSVWASLNDDGSKLHLIVINKDVNDALNFSINSKENGFQYQVESCYAIEPVSQNLKSIPSNQISVSGNLFSGNLPALNAYHIVLNRLSILTQIEEEQKVNKVILLPNPVHNSLFVNHLPEGSPYQILDTQGKIILSANYNGKAIDVRDYKKGIYLFKTGQEIVKFKVE